MPIWMLRENMSEITMRVNHSNLGWSLCYLQAKKRASDDSWHVAVDKFALHKSSKPKREGEMAAIDAVKARLTKWAKS